MRFFISAVKFNEDVRIKNHHEESQAFERTSSIVGKPEPLPKLSNNTVAATDLPRGTTACFLSRSPFFSTLIPNSLARAKILSNLDLLFDFKISSISYKDNYQY